MTFPSAMWYNDDDDYDKPVSPHPMRGGWARRMEMLDVTKLDKWLNSHTEECLRCGAQAVEFAALEGGLMVAHCFACGHGLKVRIDTIRAVALSEEAMKALMALVRDKRLPITFRADCDMILCLTQLYKKFFGEEWPASERKLREEAVQG